MEQSASCLARRNRSTRSPGPLNSSPSTSASSARRPAPPATANSASSATTPPAPSPTPPAARGCPAWPWRSRSSGPAADEEAWERRWRELSDQDGEEPKADSPYVGLKAFTEKDADRFFGRERLVGKLLGKLEHHD